jgi:YhcN/YlaJ family sporulation lipoprotein
MKIYKFFTILTLLFSFTLAGCARNDVNNNDVAYRNNNGMQPTGTDYPNRTGVRDVNDTNDIKRTDLRGNRTVNDIRNNAGNIDRSNNGVLNDNMNGKSRMHVADQAANKIADMREVDTANVIATNNNAYVAVKLAGGEKLTNSLESRISKSVKSVDRNIDRVYVSANPDFYNHMRGYTNDIRAGKPVSGFYNEFSQTIQRVFPDVK